jgi:hypothetical protein
MKKNALNIVHVLLLSCIAFFSCNKEPLTELTYGIDPATQQSLLCRSLRINGKNINGDMPSGIGTGAAFVLDHPSAVEVSAGVLLFIPYEVNNQDRVCQLYLQVEGADNYWETTLAVDAASQQPYFEILIPKFVQDGEFDLVFSVADCNGNVSQVYSTQTIVSPLADCSSSISGSVGITVRAFDLGDKPGRAGFSYEMYTIPDRLDIRYNGKWVASTGTLFNNNTLLPNCNGASDGFVSGTGTLEFDYDPSVSRFVEVYISGCNAGTEWVVSPICPDDFALVGVHTSVSSIHDNIWNYGHAWITITKGNTTTRYGLWPDYNGAIEAAGLSNGVDSDRRINFEQGTGKFSRFKYIAPDQLLELETFINKHWEYSFLTRNCATFAQKSWKVATADVEDLDANEFWNGSPVESPRVLGSSILTMEAIDPTGYLRPTDVPQVNDPLDSFN